MTDPNNIEQRSAGFSIPVPWSKEPIKVRGLGTVMTLMLLAVGIIAYTLWEHKADAKQNVSEFIAAVREMTAAQKEGTVQQRLMNCIISLPQEKREREFFSADSFCKRMSAP